MTKAFGKGGEIGIGVDKIDGINAVGYSVMDTLLILSIISMALRILPSKTVMLPPWKWAWKVTVAVNDFCLLIDL